MEARGNLIVSTKATGKNIPAYVVCIIACILGLLLGIVFIANFDSFAKMGREVFSSKPIGVLFGIILIALCFAGPGSAFLVVASRGESFCEVYENALVGITGVDVKFSNAKEAGATQKFEISYDEIENVTESGNIICIYTKYTTYKVGARNNREAAIREIRARIRK